MNHPARKVSDTLDLSHASPGAVAFLSSYFAAKSAQDVDETMRHFSPEMATYTDAILGWAVNGYDAVKGSFEAVMPNFGEGLSYPTLIMGDFPDGNGSALVAFTNTPEIVGSELRVLAPVDVREGKIVRWVDYWDSRAFDDALYAKVRSLSDSFPREYKEGSIGSSASPIITDVATRLQLSIAAGDAAAAADLFDDDALVEDMSLRVQIVGKAAIGRYFGRTLKAAPLGSKSRLRHVVGGHLGGGFEWYGSPHTEVTDGITALALDADGEITRATTVYDGRQLGDEKRQSLILLSTAP